VTATAQRIISLLPGATEWVCELGLADRLVGVSHECDFPSEVNSLPRVTRARIDFHKPSCEIDREVREHCDTKTPLYDLEEQLVEQLQPNLFITQSLCNVCAISQRDVLKTAQKLANNCQILDLQAETFDQVMNDAGAIAQATGNQHVSLHAIDQLQSRIDRVRNNAPARRRKVTLIEWADPIFCSGHWTPQLIEWAGGDDPLGRAGTPSRTIEARDLVAANPEVLLVACCGLDKERTTSEIKLLEKIDGWATISAVQNGQVHPFDGSAYFNRPGPRLVDALEVVADVIHRLG
jgi:iron complex transport system substrate-binding protein